MKTIGIAGYSGSGKTTLIEKVIPQLVMEGFRVSLIKHAHHEFDIDQPGKDSHRHRMAGATEVMITSSNPLGIDARAARRAGTFAGRTVEALFGCAMW